MHFTRCYHIYGYLRKPYVKEYSANAFPFALSVHLIDCVLFASTIQTLYKCTFYFYLHFIGFTCCVYYKSVLKIKSTRIGNVLFFIHLYKKKKTDWSYTSSRCTNLECCCQKIFKEEKPVHDLSTKLIIFFSF